VQVETASGLDDHPDRQVGEVGRTSGLGDLVGVDAEQGSQRDRALARSRRWNVPGGRIAAHHRAPHGQEAGDRPVELVQRQATFGQPPGDAHLEAGVGAEPARAAVRPRRVEPQPAAGPLDRLADHRGRPAARGRGLAEEPVVAARPLRPPVGQVRGNDRPGTGGYADRPGAGHLDGPAVHPLHGLGEVGVGRPRRQAVAVGPRCGQDGPVGRDVAAGPAAEPQCPLAEVHPQGGRGGVVGAPHGLQATGNDGGEGG
jgi:hypothetical protein